MKHLVADWQTVWRDFAQQWKASAGKAWLLYVIFVAVTWLVMGWFDESLLKWIQGRSSEANLNEKWHRTDGQASWFEVSRWLHEYTKYEWLNLPMGGICLIIGLVKVKPEWRQAGLAVLLAGGLAGFAGQTIKTVTGRPRPSTLAKNEMAQTAYDFRGPTYKGGWRGYPSGHSAAVWASCIALGLRFRKRRVFLIMIPLVLIASVVAWSRIYGNYHWPTDVLHGSALGLLFGWLFKGNRLQGMKSQ